MPAFATAAASASARSLTCPRPGACPCRGFCRQLAADRRPQTKRRRRPCGQRGLMARDTAASIATGSKATKTSAARRLCTHPSQPHTDTSTNPLRSTTTIAHARRASARAPHACGEASGVRHRSDPAPLVCTSGASRVSPPPARAERSRARATPSASPSRLERRFSPLGRHPVDHTRSRDRKSATASSSAETLAAAQGTCGKEGIRAPHPTCTLFAIAQARARQYAPS